MSKSFNGKKYLIIGAIFAVGFFSLPSTVKAATTVYFNLEKPTIYEGDIFLINLKISALDKSINVIDGTLIYDNNKLEIREVSIGGSLFELWSKPPTFSNEEGSLNFVGGVPGGFQDKEGEVLKIVFLAKSEGEAKIDFLDGFSVFLYDGRGTQINPWLRPLSLNIIKRPPEISAKDEWRDLLEKDKTPPEFVETIISSDPRIFDNQHFVSFFGVDKDSGIAYFEIKEGDLDFVRTESPHLLQDQSLESMIQIKAVDKAGNEKIITPLAPPPTVIPYEKYFTWGIWVLVIVWVLLGFILLFALWRLVKNKLK